MDYTTTTDSLGIVTLTSAAFKRGQLKEADFHEINECADGFTRVLSVANRYRAVTGQSLALDQLPSPARLREHVERGDFTAALAEARAIKAPLEALFQAARQRLDSGSAPRP